MKNIRKNIALLLLCALACAFAFSCSNEGNTAGYEAMDMSTLSSQQLEEYATLGGYTGLEVNIGSAQKGEAVWRAVRENATVKSYPEQQLNYYISQIEAQYKYYAEQTGKSYEEMLGEFGVTEESIRAEAEEMAIGDVIYELVRRAANITLDEDEKQMLFDKYVEKYVADYGYTEEYVKGNMSELIFESMLYDKTTEYLIKNNILT